MSMDKEPDLNFVQCVKLKRLNVFVGTLHGNFN
jgi:hypothetical protein